MTDQEILSIILHKITNVEQNVVGLKADVRNLQEGQEKILKGQEVIREQVVKNSEDISQLATKKELDKLNCRLDYQYVRISKIEEDVFDLKLGNG